MGGKLAFIGTSFPEEVLDLDSIFPLVIGLSNTDTGMLVMLYN